MKLPIIPNTVIWTAAVIMAIALVLTMPAVPQSLADNQHTLSADASTPQPLFSSSNTPANDPAAAAYVRLPPSTTQPSKSFRPFSTVGMATHAGLSGIGFDVATPLSKSFNLRTGSDFFSYAASFEEQGANVGVNLRMKSAHASLDWSPFGGRFRLSPLFVFANNNRVQATALIPSGSTVTLNGNNYISSFTDPLHGSGLVDFRKLSPGFSLGFGNLIPRRGHFSVLAEAGFYYVGQPRLAVNFTGSACDPTVPADIGCQSVTQDSGFQQDLTAFIARNNHNLSYASFFPILSTGFGYTF